MVLRTDIQALRGLAVLLVVLHHAKLGILEAGYLGVDIFFVISGFLITGMVKHGIEQNKFSFSEFYFRRAKRLLPAAYVTFSATALLSVIFLGGDEFSDFSRQLTGAVTFTGNIVLLNQAGYFEGEAALKPLLHVWSLSIEEQYYLLLPVTLFFLPRRFWAAGVSLVLATSLVLCIIFVKTNPSGAFYLLPARAWELAIGSLAALIVLDEAKALQFILKCLFWPAVITLALIPFWPMDGAHPGLNAFFVCISTAVIILRKHALFNSRLAPYPLAKVGDFSYSLYLVHWPIFAFINNAYVNKQPTEVHLLAVLCSLIVGFLLYRYVEVPVKNSDIKVSRQWVGLTLLISLLIISIPMGIQMVQKPTTDYTEVRRKNAGFDLSCEFAQNFTPKAKCKNSDKLELLVWGDSFAMHLVPGIVASTHAGVVQATRSVCAPFSDMAFTDHKQFNRTWSEKCLAFNKSVLDYLAVTPSIKTVVLSSPFKRFVTKGDEIGPYYTLMAVDGELVEVKPSVSGTVEGMRRTVDYLHRMGKRVVIVAPPPTKSGFDIGRCLERKATGLVIFGVAGDCNIPIDDYHESQALVLDFLRRVKNEIAPVISFEEALCSDSICATSLNGTFIYRDVGHLSYEGSRTLGKKMELGELLQRVAK